ncbi:MAG: T9SS type A sorting domain-containing protein, partial [Bacteroidetes bacterium]|nr:T9SS type A sorting domain-containing protein [Bacteroidota bacterium]
SGHAVLAQRVESANVFAAGLLPATFLGYNASYNGIGTLISWSTAKEVDVAHYDIQRSSDGIVFSSIGGVDPGNAQGSYSYQFTDRQPPGGWSYYKIVIVDRDGKKQFSPVLKAFSNAGRLTLKKLLNQPSQIILQLQSGETIDAGIQVVNSTGQLLQKSNHRIETGISSLSIPTTGLGSGVYYIKLITAAGSPIVTSFIKN